MHTWKIIAKDGTFKEIHLPEGAHEITVGYILAVTKHTCEMQSRFDVDLPVSKYEVLGALLSESPENLFQKFDLNQVELAISWFSETLGESLANPGYPDDYKPEQMEIVYNNQTISIPVDQIIQIPSVCAGPINSIFIKEIKNALELFGKDLLKQNYNPTLESKAAAIDQILYFYLTLDGYNPSSAADLKLSQQLIFIDAEYIAGRLIRYYFDNAMYL